MNQIRSAFFPVSAGNRPPTRSSAPFASIVAGLGGRRTQCGPGCLPLEVQNWTKSCLTDRALPEDSVLNQTAFACLPGDKIAATQGAPHENSFNRDSERASVAGDGRTLRQCACRARRLCGSRAMRNVPPGPGYFACQVRPCTIPAARRSASAGQAILPRYRLSTRTRLSFSVPSGSRAVARHRLRQAEPNGHPCAMGLRRGRSSGDPRDAHRRKLVPGTLSLLLHGARRHGTDGGSWRTKTEDAAGGDGRTLCNFRS